MTSKPEDKIADALHRLSLAVMCAGFLVWSGLMFGSCIASGGL